MYLFTLHNGAKEFRIVSARVGETPRQAAMAWGGKFIPRPGGMTRSSSDPDELGVCGVVRFPPELFREMDDTDIALAGGLPGNMVYTRGGIALLANRGETVELTLRQTNLASDDSPRLSVTQATCYCRLLRLQRLYPWQSFTMTFLCDEIISVVSIADQMIYRLRDKGLVKSVTRGKSGTLRWKIVTRDFIGPDGKTINQFLHCT